MATFLGPAATNLQLKQNHAKYISTSLPLIKIGASSDKEVQRFERELIPSQAMSSLALVINEAPFDSPVYSLSIVKRSFENFLNDEMFIRLLQTRVGKLIDNILLPSLVFAINHRHNPETVIYYPGMSQRHKNVEVKPVWEYCCEIIKALAEMVIAKQLIIDEDRIILLMDHLIAYSSALKNQEFLLDVGKNEVIWKLIRLFPRDKKTLDWFSRYRDQAAGNPHFKMVLCAFFREWKSLGPVKEYWADRALKQGLMKTLEKFFSGSMHAAKPSEVTPVFEAVPNLPTAYHSVGSAASFAQKLLSNRIIQVPTWYNIFEQFSTRSSNPTITTRTPNQVEQPQESSSNRGIKAFLSRVFHFWSHRETSDGERSGSFFNHQHHHHHHHHYHISQWFHWSSIHIPEPSKSKRKKHKSAKKITTQKHKSKWAKQLNQKKRIIAKRKRIAARRTRPIVAKNRRIPSRPNQKLHYYYKLHKQSAKARHLKDRTLEKTYLGELRGGFHRMQLRYQAKLDKLSCKINGF